MADVETRTEDWNTLPWKDIQKNVFRLQRRIYQAARQNEAKRVHDLQRLLLRSWSARCLAVLFAAEIALRELDAIEHVRNLALRAGAEVVQNSNLVSVSDQAADHVRADESGATGYQMMSHAENSHRLTVTRTTG